MEKNNQTSPVVEPTNTSKKVTTDVTASEGTANVDAVATGETSSEGTANVDTAASGGTSGEETANVDTATSGEALELDALAQKLMHDNRVKEIWRCPIKGYWFTREDYANDRAKAIDKPLTHFTLK